MTPKEGSKIISRKKLYKIRKKKIQDEITAAKRILKRDIEPLEIADKFLHESFKLMKEGLSNQYPELSEQELNQKIRQILSLEEKIKKHKNRVK
jgi:hypothetical protein